MIRTWDQYTFHAKMQLIGDALGVRYWSSSDCGCEDMVSLLDILQARGSHGDYVRHLAVLLSIQIDTITPEQIAMLMTSDLDVQYHAAARALGVNV